MTTGMLFRATRTGLHQPLIRFRYAIAKNGGQSLQPPVAVASAAPVASFPTIVDSFDQLPPHLRPRYICPEELELVMMGGIPSYELKSKKKAA